MITIKSKKNETPILAHDKKYLIFLPFCSFINALEFSIQNPRSGVPAASVLCALRGTAVCCMRL